MGWAGRAAGHQGLWALTGLQQHSGLESKEGAREETSWRQLKQEGINSRCQRAKQSSSGANRGKIDCPSASTLRAKAARSVPSHHHSKTFLRKTPQAPGFSSRCWIPWTNLSHPSCHCQPGHGKTAAALSCPPPCAHRHEVKPD